MALVIPIEGGYRVTSIFGDRRNYGQHEGIDLAPSIRNARAISSFDGVVQSMGTSGPYGNHLRILSNDGRLRTVYAHLNNFLPGIRVGVRVRAGQPIGVVGATGNSTGVHLHYGVQRIEGHRFINLDPLPFLRNSSRVNRLEQPRLSEPVRTTRVSSPSNQPTIQRNVSRNVPSTTQNRARRIPIRPTQESGDDTLPPVNPIIIPPRQPQNLGFDPITIDNNGVDAMGSDRDSYPQNRDPLGMTNAGLFGAGLIAQITQIRATVNDVLDPDSEISEQISDRVKNVAPYVAAFIIAVILIVLSLNQLVLSQTL